MAQIYLDRFQCDNLQAKYFAADTITVAADALLKGQDYDDEHKAVLVPLGSKQLVAKRFHGDPPGWFNITHVDGQPYIHADEHDDRVSITVHQRSDDWHACITGDDARWESGRSRAEAIGKMFLNPQNADLQGLVKIDG